MEEDAAAADVAVGAVAVLVAAVVAVAAEMVVVIAVDAGVEVVVAVVGAGMVVAVVDDDAAAAAVGTADVGLQNALQKPESVGVAVLVHQDGNRWVASGS